MSGIEYIAESSERQTTSSNNRFVCDLKKNVFVALIVMHISNFLRAVEIIHL